MREKEKRQRQMIERVNQMKKGTVGCKRHGTHRKMTFCVPFNSGLCQIR